jgi:hypothetical protein
LLWNFESTFTRESSGGKAGIAAPTSSLSSSIDDSLIKSSFLIALIDTARRWIPASASTIQGPEKADLVLLGTQASRPPNPLYPRLQARARDIA